MTRTTIVVLADTPLDVFADHVLLPTGEHALPVVDDRSFVGIACLHDVLSVPSCDRASRSVRDVMTPWERVQSIEVDRSIADVVELLDDTGLHQLPVLDEGRVIGMVHRTDVLSWLDLHTR